MSTLTHDIGKRTYYDVLDWCRRLREQDKPSGYRELLNDQLSSSSTWENFLRGLTLVMVIPHHGRSRWYFELPDDATAMQDDWYMIGRDLGAALLEYAASESKGESVTEGNPERRN